MTTVAYVGVGANVGDPRRTIEAAREALATTPGVRVTRVSSLRETDPVGFLDQPRFLNGVFELETTLSAGELMRLLLATEATLGRRRGGTRFGPRTIDLDLLLFGELVVEEPGLQVPHPRLHEREFALEPLVELVPDLRLPGRGAAAELLAAVRGVHSGGA
ncbi:MAG: 2-amino-4-hydroxy-6-hydroxymethyldihydropteridine diphosphokinase [Gaiella sp.]